MSDANTNANYSGAGNDTLLMDFNIFNQRRTSMLSAVDRLVFDTRPSQMEGKVCGTETIMELMSQWDKVAKTSMNFRDFYMGCVDKSLVETADSIYATNDQVANALNIFGDSTNVFGSVQGDDTLVEMLANQDPGDIDSINGLENAGDQDPGYLAALHAAMLQSGYNLNKVGDREEFMERYNIDEATMERVEQMYEECKNGDTSCIDKLDKYQNGKKDFSKLTPAEVQELTDLAVLYTWSGYVLEHKQGDEAELDTHKQICGKFTEKLYSVKALDPEIEAAAIANGDTSNVVYISSADHELIGALKVVNGSLGATDTLTYNILTKVENDATQYIVQHPDSNNYVKNVLVDVDYDESGFASVLIQDGYGSDEPAHRTQFLVTGKDYAKEYYEKTRDSVSNNCDHGITYNEYVGMYQAVESLSDLALLDNIVKSDKQFKINGENALDVDFVSCHRDNVYYDPYISDEFSVVLAQMGSSMLYRNKTDDYQMFVNAALSQKYDGKNSDHDLMLDIASGAGIYANACAINVLDDEIGGGNDQELKENLNAANANYGVFANLDIREEFDETPSIFEKRKFSNFKVGEIGYNANTGKIHFSVEYDMEEGLRDWTKGIVGGLATDAATTMHTGMSIQFNSEILAGNLATIQREEYHQSKLKEELDRKQKELVVDSVIELTGNINPLLKCGLAVGKDVLNASDTMESSASLVQEGFKTLSNDSKLYDIPTSSGLTIFSALNNYIEAVEDYNENMAYSTDTQKLQSFYSYNAGANSVGLSSYDNIRDIQNWEKNGVVEIASGPEMSNDEIYGAIYNDEQKGDYDKAVLKTIVQNVCNVTDYNPLGEDQPLEKDTYKNAYQYIEDEAGYTKAEIDNAMEVVIYGHSSDSNAEYQAVTDIPFDLLNACMVAVDQYSGVKILNHWEATTT